MGGRTVLRNQETDCPVNNSDFAAAHTCDLTSIELKAQGNAIPPGLGSDPNKAGQHRLWDSVQDHLSWVGVGVENLRGREIRCNVIIVEYH